MTVDHSLAEEQPPVTETLCRWIEKLSLSDIPIEVQERAKFLILDGIGCGIVGSQAPWSQVAADAIDEFEPEGKSRVIWREKVRSPEKDALEALCCVLSR